MTDDPFTALKKAFPRFRFSEQVTADGTRYVAQAPDLNASPYAVITPDLNELRELLNNGASNPVTRDNG